MAEFVSKRFHTIIDAWNCDPQVLEDKELIEKVIQDLATICQMGIIHGPVVKEGVPANPGLTGFAIIEFSHISVHTFTPSRELCVDVFSCKEFDVGQVKDYVKKTFRLKDEHTKTINVKHEGE